MKLLILGGTGAMGKPLIEYLKDTDNDVFVTSRSYHNDIDNVHYISGNAHDINFLKRILNTEYDSIIDFMSYGVSEFKDKLELLLSSTKQYVFLSSGRVYANSNSPITEYSPRLLDISRDYKYLKTDEYSLTKAREENLLKNSKNNNWTIIRPYITYGDDRLQLGVFEKETWLNRVMNDKCIVFSRDMLCHVTTLTLGDDVSKRIMLILGEKTAYGEVIGISTSEFMTWEQVLDIYVDEIFKVTGKKVKVHFINNSKRLSFVMKSVYQVKYDRLFDRTFDNSKIKRISGCQSGYMSMEKGLRTSLDSFIKNNHKFKETLFLTEAYCDRITGEKIPLKEIRSAKNMIKYFIGRYTPYFRIKYRNI